MRSILWVLIGFLLLLPAVQGQDWDDFEMGKILVTAAIEANGYKVRFRCPFPEHTYPPYDFWIEWLGGGDETMVGEFIGCCAGAIASWTKMTTWWSRDLYIEVGNKIWRISTEDCRKILQIEGDIEPGLYLIMHLEEIK